MPSTSFAIALSIFMGFAGVLQAGLNRTIGHGWGLWAAVWLNSTLLFLFATAIAVVMLRNPGLFPEILRIRPGGEIPWWFFLPAFFGLCLVAGVPFAMAKIGSMNVFVILVACQITGSLIWDRVMEDLPVTPNRLGGALLAIAGAVLASLRRV